MANEWSYYVMSMGNLRSGVADPLQAALTTLGEEGWELVTATSSVKTLVNLNGNDLIFIFKKAGAGHRPPTFAAYGYADEIAY